MVFPDSIGKMLGLNREPKPVGVLIGVRESSPPPRHPAVVAQAPQNDSRTAPAVAASQPANPSVAPQTQAPTNAETQRNPSGIRPADVQQAQIANAEPEVAAAPTDSAQNSPGATLDTSPSADTAGNASAQENVEPPTTTASRSSSQGEKKSVTSTYARPRAAQSSKTSPHGRRGSVRSRVVGITADGRLILRLSSGRTAIVAPDEDATPRHRNRVFSDRDETSGPPSRFGPDYFPDD